MVLRIKLVLLIICSLAMYEAVAQVTLSIDHGGQDDTDGEVNNTAIQEVNLLPNYDYVAGNNRSMNAYLDPTIIAPPNYGNLFSEEEFDNYQINTELEVGYTPGFHGVSPSGAATYTVPIQLPPGTNGMEPELAISYNSQAGNGLLGMGWNLAGLSVISRVGKTIYHDGKPDRIRFDNSDRFALDGNRLVTTSVNAFATEQETFSLITSHGSAGSGPAWFEVRTKDGMTLEYGKTDDSRYVVTENGEALNWMLNKVYDQHGNYMQYIYIQDNNQIRVDKIRYTGNEAANLEPYNEVQFYYQDREDVSEGYVGGSYLKSSYLLHKIVVKSEGMQFRSYKINYANDDLYSFLTSVQLFGEDSQTAFNETIFEYEKKSWLQQAPVFNQISRSGLPLTAPGPGVSNAECGQEGQRIAYFPGDFNGDGVTDLLGVRYWINTTDASEARYISWSIYINDNAGGAGFTCHPLEFEPGWLGNDGEYSTYNPLSQFPVSGFTFHIGDITGDGLDDIILGSKMNWNDDLIFYNAFIVSNGVDGVGVSEGIGTLEMHDFVYNPWPNPNQYNRHAVQLGDFDGDGILEFFAINLSSMNYQITSFNGRVDATKNHYLFAHGIMEHGTAHAVDFNGDGKHSIDLRYRENMASQRRIFHFNISNNGSSVNDEMVHETSTYFMETGDFIKGPSTHYIDFNGDGISDMTGVESSEGGWYKNFNIWYYKGKNPLTQGDSELYSEVEVFSVYHTTELDNLVYTRDINGDGKTDVIRISENGTTLHIYLAQNGLEDFHEYTATLNSPINFDVIHFGDMNGDGNLEMILKNHFNGFIEILTINPKTSTKDRRLKRVKNGFLQTAEFRYKTLAETAHLDYDVYGDPLHGPPEAYPLRKLYGSFSVVSQVLTKNSIGETVNTWHHFFGGLVHMRGKGFLGFEKIRSHEINPFDPFGGGSENITEQRRVYNEYELNTQHFILLPSNSKTFIGQPFADGALVTETANDYIFNSSTDGSYWTEWEETTTQNYLNNQYQTETYFYDDNGNVTTKNNVVGQDGTSEITTTTYEEYYSMDNWHVPSLPQLITINTQRNDETEIEEKTSIEYNGDGTLLSKTSRPLTNAWSKESYTYYNNPFGLVESITFSGLKPTDSQVSGGELTFTNTESIDPVITDQYIYSDNGRNVLEHTDRFGFTTQYTYYNRWGKPKTVTDYQGRQNYFEYDGFGRIKKEVDYLVQTVLTERAFVNANPVFSGCDSDSDILYQKTTTLPHDRTTITKYNALGQLRFTQQTGQFNDLYSSICYDEQGREIEKTTPHFNGDSNFKTAVVQYDEYGRVDERNLNPIETSMLYETQIDGHRTTLTSNAGGTRTSKTDLTGRVIETTDPGGTLTRTYLSGGLLKKIELDGVQIVENTYDEFGRQIKLDDMNAGATYYNYDSFDNLIFQQDANGNILETEYDEQGRIEARTVSKVGENNGDPLGSYDYEYYTDGPEETLLKKETALSGHATEYTYDDDQNIASITEIIDGQPYTTSFDYDEFGKPTRKEYPSGFAIRYEYDDKAYLERVTSDDGQLIIWEITGGNAQGQLTSYTLGNGLAITKAYDDDFFPENTTAQNGQNTVFSFHYTFDPVTGNLLSRNLGAEEEHFFYDTDGKHLNRLAGTGPDEFTVSETYSFADNGNIAQKHGVGQYFYDGQKKNAVTQIDIPGLGDIQEQTQQVQYNHFNSASEITDLDHQLRVNLEYGPDDQRRLAKYWDDSGAQAELIKTRIYAGAFEKQINADLSETEVHYISAGGMLVAMYVVEDGTGSYYYPHLDHLGSIIHITDANGDIVYTQSFDPWGRTRNADDLTYEDITPRPEWLWRGYTGHEHLDEFGLINMNGRMYDPVVGRMLSPDNYVQSPDFSQSYNRYSYVFNNPLKYYDPSGELAWFVPVIIGAVVGQYVGGALANNDLNPFAWDYSSSDTWVGMGAGAVIGAAAGYGYAGMVGAKGVASFMAPAVGKKVFAAGVGGTMNTISHHDPDKGIGWHTLGYFGVGAAGSFLGVHTGSPIAGFNVGGIANAVYSAAIGDIELDGYQLVQRYVSGGLSALSGTSSVKVKGAKLIGGKSKFAHLSNKFVSYGIQSTAYDFAFSKQEDFTSRTLLEHATIFASGGIAGTVMYESSTGMDNLLEDRYDFSRLSKHLLSTSKSAMTMGALIPDWISAGRAKGGFNYQYTGGSQQKKTGLSLLKSFLIGF